jgi:predicted RNase H-like HicB family nuclease
MARVHQRVLDVANQLASQSKDGTFTINGVVRALPELNANSVRTHVASRCCVDANKNHPHKWDYFRRVGRGRYQVTARYRQTGRARKRSDVKADHRRPHRSPEPRADTPTRRRDAIHAVVQRDASAFVAECMEVAVVTQGDTLDEVTANLKQAVALHLDGEDMAALGLTDSPRLRILVEIPLAS